MVVTPTKPKPKATYKELAGGGFEFNGRTFNKEGKEVIKSGSGVYYNIDEPSKSYVREGEGFKEVAVSQADKESVKDTTYGRPKRLGDTIGGSNNKSGIYQEGQSKPSEAGVLTATPTEANFLKPRSELPIWTVSSTKPSEAVKEGAYASEVSLYKDPLGRGQTAGSYEYNTAMINIYEKASRGITIDAKQIQASKEYARRERLSGDPTKNVRLFGNELKVWTARQGVSFVNFNVNLLATMDGVPWGTIDLNKNIAPTPTVPSITKGVGGWIKELPNRPSTIMDITLAGSLVGSTLYGGITFYKSLRASGLSKAGAVDIIAGETISSFSPYGKIESGIKGAYVSVGDTRQLKGTVDTLKLGEIGGVGGEISKGLYSSKGFATYYTPKEITYGSIKTTLSKGTVGTINTITAIDYEIVNVAGLTSATTTPTSNTYTRGFKTSTSFTTSFEPVNSYDYGVVGGLQLEGKSFKTFGISRNVGEKASIGKANSYYTDYKNALSKEGGNVFSKNLKDVDYENFRVTFGKSGAVVKQGEDLNLIRAKTRYIDLKKGTGSSLGGEEGGGFSSGSRGSRGGVVNTQLEQKSLMESSITSNLQPQTSKINVVSKSLVKSLSLGGSGLALGSSFIMLNKQGMVMAPQQIKQISNVKTIQKISPSTLTKTTVGTAQITGTITSTLNPNLTPNISGGLSSPPTTPAIPIFAIPLPLGLDLELGGSSRSIGSKVIKGYVPSFNALVYKIRGSKPKGTETGLRVRPIPKGFSWAKAIKRK